MRPPLTELQAAILELIWSSGQTTADAMRTALHPAHPLKDSTVRTMLRRLEAHGYLHHRVVGKTFVYEAAMSPQRLAASGVRQIIDRFCAGSVEQFLAGMLDEQVLTASQVDKLGGPTRRDSDRKKHKKWKKQHKREKRKKSR